MHPHPCSDPGCPVSYRQKRPRAAQVPQGWAWAVPSQRVPSGLGNCFQVKVRPSPWTGPLAAGLLRSLFPPPNRLRNPFLGQALVIHGWSWVHLFIATVIYT